MKFKLSLILFILVNVSMLMVMSCVSLPDPQDNTRSLIILSFKGEAADKAYIVKLKENGEEDKVIRETKKSYFYKDHDARGNSYVVDDEGYLYFTNVKPGRYTIKKIHHEEVDVDTSCSIIPLLSTKENETYTDVIFPKNVSEKFIINVEPQKVYFLGDFCETDKVISFNQYQRKYQYMKKDGKTPEVEVVYVTKRKVIGNGVVTKAGRNQALRDLIKKYPDSKWIQYLENDEGSIENKQD